MVKRETLTNKHWYHAKREQLQCNASATCVTELKYAIIYKFALMTMASVMQINFAAQPTEEAVMQNEFGWGGGTGCREHQQQSDPPPKKNLYRQGPRPCNARTRRTNRGTA